MTPRNIEQIIDKQIRQWHLHQELQSLKGEETAAPPRPVIAISREMGCGGLELARSLARRLDFQIHGKSLIDQIASDKGLERKVVEQLDERTRSEMNIWVEGIINRRLFSHDEYHVSLAKAIKTIAAHGGVIILGRGAHVILGGDNCLRVRVVAPLENRVSRVMDLEKIGETEARERIAVSDAERVEFHRKLYGLDPNDPYQYDLVLNTDRLHGRCAVNLVLTAMEARGLFGD